MYEFIYDYPTVVLISTIVLMSIIFLPAFFPKFGDLLKKLIENIANNTDKSDNSDESLQELLLGLGYFYDTRQDIFYSDINAWQRDMGYCRLYDEAAAPMSMIIDCEPIYFEYDNKRWLIEFWKGQYGMTTGCEIGVYATEELDVHTEYFNGTFYECASDDELLRMSFELEKNGIVLLKRNDVHWWLTAFILGEFSEPKELTVYLKITLKDKIMRNEFVKGLISAGYEEDEIVIINNTVRLAFDKPRTPQPYTRNDLSDYFTQEYNKGLCEKFNEIAKEQTSSIDKIKFIRDIAPDMFDKIFKLGRSKDAFNAFYHIKNK